MSDLPAEEVSNVRALTKWERLDGWLDQLNGAGINSPHWQAIYAAARAECLEAELCAAVRREVELDRELVSSSRLERKGRRANG